MSGSGMDTGTEDLLYHDPEFQASDADVCIVSSDNILFKVHSTNLRVHSSIFPVVPGSAISLDDPVRMSERGEVLRVVFKYIYPDPPLPNLGALPFHTLEEVAMTADKYQFLALMQLCDRYMEDHAEAQPAAVLKYAYLRNEDAMLDRIAPHTISLEVFDAAQRFDSVLFKRWMLYREACIGFIGALSPEGGETYKALEVRLKEWMRRNTAPSDPIPPKFSPTASAKDWSERWGALVREKVYVRVKRS